MVEEQIVYISLGCDCAVRYQLEKHNLIDVTYPFDWIKINNINMLCDIIDTDFSIFFERYNIKTQCNNFNNFDEENIKSRLQIKLCNGIIMPHEANEYKFDEKLYREKYIRRIDRFRCVIRDNKIKKIFIRADEKQIMEIQKKKLYDKLNLFGCVNYDIKFINYGDYKCNEEFTWQRKYIPWINYFTR